MRSAEAWAEAVTAAVWDRPQIETREEFKAALLHVFLVLTGEPSCPDCGGDPSSFCCAEPRR